MYLEIFLADFAVFCVFLGISRVRDRAKYQKPCLLVSSMKYTNALVSHVWIC